MSNDRGWTDLKKALRPPKNGLDEAASPVSQARPGLRYPVLRPLLPTADTIVPLLERIDAQRWYTNHGPLLAEFEAGLAAHFMVEPDHIVTSANATLALAQTLRALAIPGADTCIMPAWTFVATPASAVWAGLNPFFVDVDPETWLIRPEHVAEIAKHRRIAAVVVTSAFGAPLDLAPWDRLTQQTGIPVVVDAAAGFDGFAGLGMRRAHTPVAISLHATKVSGVGEGGVVVTNDAETATRIRRYGNFGFAGSRDATVVGTNAKMSEFTAAVGLAFLSEWPARREAWAALSTCFAKELAATPSVRAAPGFNGGWISSYGLIELSPLKQAKAVTEALCDLGIETRQWWGEGCHLSPAYKAYGRSSLPETERLGRHVLGLPFWLGLTGSDMAAIFAVLRKVLASERER